MGAGHDRNRRRPAAGMASAWDALCRLPVSDPWFWLVRSSALEGAQAVGVVLLEGLPRLLDALGAGAAHHG